MDLNSEATMFSDGTEVLKEEQKETSAIKWLNNLICAWWQWIIRL